VNRVEWSASARDQVLSGGRDDRLGVELQTVLIFLEVPWRFPECGKVPLLRWPTPYRALRYSRGGKRRKARGKRWNSASPMSKSISRES